MTTDELKAAIASLNLSPDELDDFVVSLYETPAEEVPTAKDEDFAGPEGWSDTLKGFRDRWSSRGEDFDEDAFDDEIAGSIADAWGEKGWPSEEEDFDEWSDKSGFSKFRDSALSSIYDDGNKTEVEADVNNDGDSDVKATDKDGDGKVDEVTTTADSDKEADKADKVADEVEKKSSCDNDMDSTGETQRNITSALIDHRL